MPGAQRFVYPAICYFFAETVKYHASQARAACVFADRESCGDDSCSRPKLAVYARFRVTRVSLSVIGAPTFCSDAHNGSQVFEQAIEQEEVER
jgi:hypothetical protein